jgi:metal-responsive CopG/Arc/MetJ family transcriptional regulator
MAETMNISVADKVYEEITRRMAAEGKSNRSEYVEELIRIGLAETKEVEKDGQQQGRS